MKAQNTPKAGDTVRVTVRHFAADPRFAFPGASFDPTVTETKEYDVTIDAQAIGESLIPAEWRKKYVNMQELPRLLRQQHGVYGPFGVTI